LSNLIRWPLTALGVWGAAWYVYIFLVEQGMHSSVAMLFATLVGVSAAAMGWHRGMSQARAAALAMGFPVSFWLLGTASLPAWVWLLPLVLIVWIYPLRAWRDAPVFPTPLNALRDVPRFAILPAQAKILDAGCGAGDGLKALREAYINAQWIGIEFSRPLSWVAKFRCPWAEVRCGDIWEDHWGAYDMVYLFQRPETMPRAVEKAKAEMKPGAWLVSLEFEAADLKPTATTEASPHRPVWLYQAPFAGQSRVTR
jgi:SAM-dependent methyltransferase